MPHQVIINLSNLILGAYSFRNSRFSNTNLYKVIVYKQMFDDFMFYDHRIRSCKHGSYYLWALLAKIISSNFIETSKLYQCGQMILYFNSVHITRRFNSVWNPCIYFDIWASNNLACHVYRCIKNSSKKL